MRVFLRLVVITAAVCFIAAFSGLVYADDSLIMQEIAGLKKRLGQLEEKVTQYEAQSDAQKQRIAELESKLKAAGQISPSTPSGQRPIYTKAPARKRKGRPGAKVGHKGTRRPKPDRNDRREEHRLVSCPDCGSGSVSKMLSVFAPSIGGLSLAAPMCEATGGCATPNVPGCAKGMCGLS